MIKILFMGDTHLDIERPYAINRIRKKSFLNVLQQIIDYALSNEIDLICHLGDLFDNYRPSPTQVSFVIKQLLRLDEKGIKFYLIRGNHDGAADIDDLFRGWSGDYVKIPNLPNVELIDPRFDEIRKLKTIGYRDFNEKIRIHGLGYYRHETPQVISKYIKDEIIDSNKFNILLLHSYIESINDSNRITLSEMAVNIDQILGLNLDLVALGHSHHKVEPQQKLNTTFFSPGSPIDWRFRHIGSHGFYVMELNEQTRDFQFNWYEIDNDFKMVLISIDGKKTPRPSSWFENQLKKELEKLKSKSDKKLILEIRFKGTYEKDATRLHPKYIREVTKNVLGEHLLHLGAISLKALQYEIKKEIDIDKIRNKRLNEETILEILKGTIDDDLAQIILDVFKEIESNYSDPTKISKRSKKSELNASTRMHLQNMIKDKIYAYYKNKNEDLDSITIPISDVSLGEKKKETPEESKKKIKRKVKKKEQQDLTSLLKRSLEEN